ncbi:MAG: hybrid sensor histidine kinase/response regulator, partial [Calditrichia bacterium]|nr:hybrid sensor histidine kinase/response regulator [Calditrichia bacterium]
KIGGKELADQIKKINPKIPILFMSGYTNGTIVHDGILDQETEFIQKPFTPAALTGKVRKVLDKNKS